MASTSKHGHGGKGRGQGRKPGPFAPYQQKSVNLSVAAWRFIALYELTAGARSESDAIERLLRSHPLFQEPEQS